MDRKLARRRTPTLENLEGRDLPSGLVASPQVAPHQTATLPYIEQDNGLLAPPSAQRPTTGGPVGIIAILIG